MQPLTNNGLVGATTTPGAIAPARRPQETGQAAPATVIQDQVGSSVTPTETAPRGIHFAPTTGLQPEAMAPQQAAHYSVGPSSSRPAAASGAPQTLLELDDTQPMEAATGPSLLAMAGVKFVGGTRAMNEAYVRTYEKDAYGVTRMVSLEDLASRPVMPPPFPREFQEISPKALKSAVKDAREIRQASLENLQAAPSSAAIMPEDGSLTVTAFHMSPKDNDGCSAGFVVGMARIGTIEGFRVVAEGCKDVDELRQYLPAHGRNNLLPANLQGNRDVWLEDHGELATDGSVTVPAQVGDGQLMADSILRDRVRRFYNVEIPPDVQGEQLKQLVQANWSGIDFAQHGAVDSRNNQTGLVAMAASSGAPVRENLTYIEGGNLIPGRAADGTPYALVGRDSLAVSKALLERDAGRPFSTREVRMAAAKDLGVKPEQVIPVEQPGDFHIDMYIMMAGPGRVILNDSKEATRLQEQWMREDHEKARPQAGADADAMTRWQQAGETMEANLQRLHENAERKAIFEQWTIRDLQKAGLQVERMAGIFYDPNNPDDAVMNFLNCEQGKNPRGERYIICLGGDQRAEEYVSRRLLSDLDIPATRLHFLPRHLTPATLALHGGINCRAKPEGVFTPHTPPPPPAPWWKKIVTVFGG